MNDSTTLYDRVGGRPFFETLTRRFYDSVEKDELLRPLYPASDEGFEAARHHLELFLIQYWGGPDDYNQTRGAPRLRMRHVDFAVGQAERDAWVAHMTDAVRAAGLPQLEELQMVGYFSTAATHLINRP